MAIRDEGTDEAPPSKDGRRKFLKALAIGGIGGATAAVGAVAAERLLAPSPPGAAPLIETLAAHCLIYKSGGSIYSVKSGSVVKSGTAGRSTASPGDDGAVFEAALGSLLGSPGAGTGGRVAILADRYYIDRTLDLTGFDNISICGEGIRNTVVQLADGVGGDLFSFNPTATTGNRYFFHWRDLQLDGGGPSNSVGSGINLKFHDASSSLSDAHLERVFVTNFIEDGIVIQNAWGLRLEKTISEFNGRNGVSIGTFGTNPKVVGCKFNNNGGDGMYLEKIDRCAIVATEMSSNGGNGLHASGTLDGLDVIGCNFQSNGLDGVHLAGVWKAWFIACASTRNSGYDVGLDSACRDNHLFMRYETIAGSTVGRTRVNGISQDSGPAHTPTALNYYPGELVDWTDDIDHTGDGTWFLGPDGSTWQRLDSSVPILSGVFPIDSAGVKLVSIPHGLQYTPSVSQCEVTIVEDTPVDDWQCGFVKVVGVDPTRVTVKVSVISQSASGGATAKLALRVGR